MLGRHVVMCTKLAVQLHDWLMQTNHSASFRVGFTIYPSKSIDRARSSDRWGLCRRALCLCPQNAWNRIVMTRRRNMCNTFRSIMRLSQPQNGGGGSAWGNGRRQILWHILEIQTTKFVCFDDRTMWPLDNQSMFIDDERVWVFRDPRLVTILRIRLCFCAQMKIVWNEVLLTLSYF